MARGGARPGAGRKPIPTDPDERASYYQNRAAQLRAETRAVAPASPKGLQIPDGLVEILNQYGSRQNPARRDAPYLNPFDPKSFHPPSVIPPKELRAVEEMAMDSAINWAVNDWNSGGFLQSVGAQGLLFPGYPFLSELAQRPEYDAFSDIIATEMTRKWIKFSGRNAKPGETDDKADDIQELESFMDDLGVRDAYKQFAKFDGLMGRAHLFHEIAGNDGMDNDPRDTAELATSILKNGKIDPQKVNKNQPLTRITNVEAVWVYPTTYNANNPLAPDFYRPQIWYTIGGRQMHVSRMPCLIGRPVPDLLKPAYSFGGLSLSQLAMPYVDIWLDTRQSIGRLIKAFSTPVLMTDLQTLMQPGGGALLGRANLFNAVRDNMSLFLLNKMTEDFKNVSVPLSGLHELQAQAQEHLSSVSRIPVAVYTGISPTGLNASSEGEIRIWENSIHAYQEARFRPHLNRTIEMCMLSLWGKVDEDIVYKFVPLREMTEKETAEINKLKAETGDLLMNGSQAIGPEEERKRIAGDPDSGYDNIDPDKEPELPEPDPLEEQKLSLSGHAAAGAGPGAKKAANANAKAPPKAANDMAWDTASVFAAAEALDARGYFNKVAGFDKSKKASKWHAQFDEDTKRITIFPSFWTLDDDNQVEVLLHEAGHAGQVADPALFAKFKREHEATLKNFLPIANEAHLHDFEEKGHVDGLAAEVWAESYAHHCMRLNMPAPLAKFWASAK